MAMAATDSGKERFHDEGDARSSSSPYELVGFGFLSLSEAEERSSGAIEVEMESDVWREMPDHLLENILARLPFWSVLRFRSVCRQWRSLSVANPSSDPLFAVFVDYGYLGGAVGAYDCSRGRWLMIPLARVLGTVLGDAPLIVAGAGGLLCADYGVGSPRRSLLVVNFLTGKCRNLPPIPHMRCAYVAGMSVQPSSPSSSYQVLLIADSRGRLVSQCYESTTGLWKMGGILNYMVALIITTVLLGNTLYCLTFGPSGLLAYHTETHTWKIVKITMPPSLVCPHVFEHNGKLLLAGGLEEYGVLNRIQIWQLDDDGSGGESDVCVWVELLRVPDLLFQKLFPHRKGHFFCIGQRGLICFADNNSLTILMCDLNTHQWRWIPPCPLDYAAKRHDPSMHMLGFSIEPRFDALV